MEGLFNMDQYTIDLTYITERVIAMSFPAEGMESTYRNRLDDVAKHLHDRHAGHFMIFNLSERPYNYTKFQDRVADWCGFPDHHPPPLALLFRIVKAMEAFLCADANNVVVVHCLAGIMKELLLISANEFGLIACSGKGRTGTVIAAFLIFIGLFNSAEEAIWYFASKRNANFYGISMASQKRYVQYFSAIVVDQVKPSFRKVVLKGISLAHVPNIEAGAARPFIEIYSYQNAAPYMEYTTELRGIEVKEYPRDALARFYMRVELCGDILIVVKHQGAFNRPKLFRVGLHTGMIDISKAVRITKADIDGIANDNRFPANFSLDLAFQEIPNSSGTVPAVLGENGAHTQPRFARNGELAFFEPIADKVSRARNASMISENSVGKAGWLMKQGQTVKSWKSRWFVLKEESISYFRTADAQQPLGSIPCEDIFTVISDDAQPCQFEIVTAARNYLIRTQDPKDVEEWTEVIERARLLRTQHLAAKKPSIGILTCTILEVADLKWEALSMGINNIYCVATIERTKVTTSVKSNTLTPVFNEAFNADVTDVNSVLSISVWSKNAKVADSFYGEMRVAMSSVMHRPLDLWVSLQRQSMLQYNVQGKIHVILFLLLHEPPAPTAPLQPKMMSMPSSVPPLPSPQSVPQPIPSPSSPKSHATSLPVTVTSSAPVASQQLPQPFSGTSPYASAQAPSSSPIAPSLGVNTSPRPAPFSTSPPPVSSWTAAQVPSSHTTPALTINTSFHHASPHHAHALPSSAPPSSYLSASPTSAPYSTPFQAARIDQAHAAEEHKPAAAVQPQPVPLTALDDPDLEDFYLLSVSKST